MTHKQKIVFNLFVGLFFSVCVSQWFFTQREDWPWSYFGMYKARIYPQNIFSYKLWGRTWDDKIIDVYSLGPSNGYAFIDKAEEIILNKKLSFTNKILIQSDGLHLDAERLNRMIAIAKSDLEPFLMASSAQQKIKSFRFEVRYWSTFTWEKRFSPDSNHTLIEANYKNDSWEYVSIL